jgi:hypothetical protein
MFYRKWIQRKGLNYWKWMVILSGQWSDRSLTLFWLCRDSGEVVITNITWREESGSHEMITLTLAYRLIIIVNFPYLRGSLFFEALPFLMGSFDILTSFSFFFLVLLGFELRCSYCFSHSASPGLTLLTRSYLLFLFFLDSRVATEEGLKGKQMKKQK